MVGETQQNIWTDITHDEGLAETLASALRQPLALGRVLAGRGIQDAKAAQTFLQPDLADLADPMALPGVKEAVERTRQAMENGERITIYGDYDCDGVTATAMLQEMLTDLGCNVNTFIPKRAEDGFGFTLGALGKVVEDNQPSLIITADCGMRSHTAVSKAKKFGVDVIIIDHHRPYGDPHPDEAVALISTELDTVPGSMKPLSASGMAFYFCRALLAAFMENGLGQTQEIDLWKYLDLVAIGTISDLMPLTGDNRILCYHGLSLLNDVSKRRPGVLALIRAAGIRTEIGSYEVGFLLGPRLNSAGRVGNADLALHLLLETDTMQCRRYAGQVDASNRERRRIEDGVVESAVDAVATELRANACGLVAAGEQWHIGTIGIVAARLSSRFYRPVAVIAYDQDGNGRGSCRSTDGVDLEKVLARCAPHLEQYGGHATAAGFGIKKEKIPAFRKTFEAACRDLLDEDALVEKHTVDAWICLSEADDALYDALQQLQPLGLGNQTPMWGVRNVRTQGPVRIVGANHLKLTIVSGATERDAIGYGLGERTFPKGPVDIIFQLQRNSFKGRQTLQLSIKDFRVAAS